MALSRWTLMMMVRGLPARSYRDPFHLQVYCISLIQPTVRNRVFAYHPSSWSDHVWNICVNVPCPSCLLIPITHSYINLTPVWSQLLWTANGYLKHLLFDGVVTDSSAGGLLLQVQWIGSYKQSGTLYDRNKSIYFGLYRCWCDIGGDFKVTAPSTSGSCLWWH